MRSTVGAVDRADWDGAQPARHAGRPPMTVMYVRVDGGRSDLMRATVNVAGWRTGSGCRSGGIGRVVPGVPGLDGRPTSAASAPCSPSAHWRLTSTARSSQPLVRPANPDTNADDWQLERRIPADRFPMKTTRRASSGGSAS
jgi:hypothetical protein